ncbi:MAG: hypothetical protein A2Z16_10695 [Chloroflexi bacterium RBG_16_54_18]|nr:MAG: hypothetical protein A2Z16_10695 [Chloroflexi bacterium RBG_16_54_18]
MRIDVTIQLTIIGLGQIGTSIGLALAKHKDLVTRVGHDKKIAFARQAEKMDAIDRVDSNLPNSVRNANLVLLCLPIDQVPETMRLIAQDLLEGAVVMDTSPLKVVVADWAKELLPAGRHYVGLTPVINPAYLNDASTGQQAAHPDLFEKGLIAITSPPRTDSDAIKLAADLTRLLGSTPLFADLAEIDGLMTSTMILPQILAAALLNATVDQPGWREGRKVAGRAYTDASGPVLNLDGSQSLKTSIISNRENVLRVLDSALAELQFFRSIIFEQDDSVLEEYLERAYRSARKWWQERLAGDWENEQSVPVEKHGFISHLIGSNPRPRQKPKSTN